jgi:hypothetical protein
MKLALGLLSALLLAAGSVSAQQQGPPASVDPPSDPFQLNLLGQVGASPNESTVLIGEVLQLLPGENVLVRIDNVSSTRPIPGILATVGGILAAPPGPAPSLLDFTPVYAEIDATILYEGADCTGTTLATQNVPWMGREIFQFARTPANGGGTSLVRATLEASPSVTYNSIQLPGLPFCVPLGSPLTFEFVTVFEPLNEALFESVHPVFSVSFARESELRFLSNLFD